ncbi:MAG: heme exporter protein CcmD [Gammaproteobacteria bacterium]|nr:heme exporter protein CcmD [Gammaproteobacteria bacterium]
MHFDSLSEFFAMGGYAFYVWLSYGVTFTLLIGLTVISIRQRRNLINEIRSKQLREQKLKEYRKGKE